MMHIAQEEVGVIISRRDNIDIVLDPLLPPTYPNVFLIHPSEDHLSN